MPIRHILEDLPIIELARATTQSNPVSSFCEMVGWRGKVTVQALFASALLLCATQLRLFFGTLEAAHGSENDLIMPASVDVKESLLSLLHTSIQSDVVELEHCSLTDLNYTHFTEWAEPILNQTWNKLLNSEKKEMIRDQATAIQDEWRLELLEMYASHSGWCDFSQYRPTVPSTAPRLTQAASTLQRVVETVPVPSNHARIVFCIVAYQDAAHLQRLVRAIHMPHHLILIHLEASTPRVYLTQVENIAEKFSNVVILEFGTVIYKTDAVSMINLRIMRWLVEDVGLAYDFHANMGGAAYPLYAASELAQHLYSTNHSVWLGELLHKGQQVHHPQSGVLYHKRLISTQHKVERKAGFIFGSKAPEWMDRVMQHKSSSGNQAVFSYLTVKRLLKNSHVMQVFATAKYACCCCVEERTWIAALNLIGLLEEAKNHTSTWQTWGGYNHCRGSMHNAVLSSNTSTCFRLEYPGTDLLYFLGNETLTHLERAKRQGFLFARKFRSDDDASMDFLKEVKTRLHGRAV
jgi:hypothetical protein